MIGERDFIVVVGTQGFGKSVWTKSYGAASRRLLVGYDPKAEYPVDYASDPKDWGPGVIDGTTKEFRFGTNLPEEVPAFGSMAFAAGECTLIYEECALLFSRGEDLAPWLRPLVYTGREPGVNLVLVAQRMMAIPIGVRSQATRIIVFFQSEPDDVKAISDRIGKQYRDEIPQLPRLTCLDWEQGKVSRYAIRP